MEAEISAGVGAFEADVVVDNDLGHPHMSFERFSVDVFWRGGACVITQRPYFPFRVDDAAVVRRKFGLGYLFSHKQRISLNSTKGMFAVEQDKRGSANSVLRYQLTQVRFKVSSTVRYRLCS